MKSTKIILPVICGIMLVGSFMVSAFASNAVPGSADDPVATKSYVDKRIADIQGTSGGLEISEYQMAFIIEEVVNSLGENTASTAAAPSYAPVSLVAGQILIGDEGTEIILRSGSATGYTTGTDGLANTTTGQDVGNNGEIGRNNLLIVPRADGRGIRAESDAWLLVKGGYRITY